MEDKLQNFKRLTQTQGASSSFCYHSSIWPKWIQTFHSTQAPGINTDTHTHSHQRSRCQ